MQYMVVAPDGKEYGPADIDTLKQWASQNRLQPMSKLRDFNTGQIIFASSLKDVFPQQQPQPPTGPPPSESGAWSQPPSAASYPRTAPIGEYKQQAFYGQDTGMGDVWGSLIRSGLALLFFFVLGGIGIIFAAYGLYYGIQAKLKGHKLGWVALIISSLTFLAVLIGWLFRLHVIGG